MLMDFAQIGLILKVIEARGAPPGPRPDPARDFATGPCGAPGPREIPKANTNTLALATIVRSSFKTATVAEHHPQSP